MNVVQIGDEVWADPAQIVAITPVKRSDEYKATILLVGGVEILSDWSPELIIDCVNEQLS